MRCKICGAKLTKEGDICSNCYKLYQEEEDLKKDTNQRLTIKRKYSIGYNMSKYWWIFLIFALSAAICIASKEYLPILGLIFAVVVILGLLLFLDKRLAKATKAIFYDKKVIYKFNFWFIHKEKTVKYSDIKDVTIFKPTFFQNEFNLGDICVYAKGSIIGTSLLNGFQVKNVENASEVLGEIGNIIGPLK